MYARMERWSSWVLFPVLSTMQSRLWRASAPKLRASACTGRVPICRLLRSSSSQHDADQWQHPTVAREEYRFLGKLVTNCLALTLWLPRRASMCEGHSSRASLERRGQARRSPSSSNLCRLAGSDLAQCSCPVCWWCGSTPAWPRGPARLAC